LVGQRLTAITYGYGGGVSLTGPIIPAGGLAPYLSLFDASGNFLVSTYYGVTCPSGANTFNGNCYDVEMDGGLLAPGTYQISITAWENLSDAENQGTGTLADGFTGLGNLGTGDRALDYAFDVVLTSNATAPEPGSLTSLALAAALCGASRLLRQRR